MRANSKKEAKNKLRGHSTILSSPYDTFYKTEHSYSFFYPSVTILRQSHFICLTSLKFGILLPQPSECWINHHASFISFFYYLYTVLNRFCIKKSQHKTEYCIWWSSSALQSRWLIKTALSELSFHS